MIDGSSQQMMYGKELIIEGDQCMESQNSNRITKCRRYELVRQ